MLTTRRSFIAAIMVAASAIVIGVQTRATEPLTVPLSGTEWTLADINGAPPLEGRETSDLRFSEDGDFTTSAGCNRFHGTARIEGDHIRFPDKLAGTMMACPEGLAAQEETVLSLLAKVRSFELEPQALILLDAQGTSLLRYHHQDEGGEALVDTKG
ncbi:META domain-containing protein [Phaeobacter sp. HF9A]|uniref:META domain-containing protein n=1 Tax=Phaeobacter sp. HF9A TaxID=2721561 RepID=UPI00142FA522|nr:META domain-containing protein [Phaeobacter sp. HF9A]NIZ14785.1 META domain-containing protein [Phaeobacter sp. HF9A]